MVKGEASQTKTANNLKNCQPVNSRQVEAGSAIGQLEAVLQILKAH
jgi:hypothetical protein